MFISDCFRSRTRISHFDLLFLALLPALFACSGGSSDNPMQPVQSPPPPSVAAAQWHGYFAGDVVIGNEIYYGEAFLAVDGMVRMNKNSPLN